MERGATIFGSHQRASVGSDRHSGERRYSRQQFHIEEDKDKWIEMEGSGTAIRHW
jgi:hypothetical protein